MLLNFNNVTEGWPFVLPPGTFDESGFPSDLFSDVDARKGFAYSFNYTSYIEEAFYAGEAIQLTCPCPVQLYYNPAQPGYSLNSSKAEEHFRTAWGGELWSEGFTITLMYNTGNELQRIAYEMLKANVENLNPKFHIYVEERPPWMVWPSPGPVFCIGWFFDVPEPYDFFSAFMYSLWGLAEYQGYNSTVVDELIEEGKHTLNQTRRREILDELQAIYFNECPSVPLGQHYKRNYQRDWIQGWYYNPAYPGEYFYHLWKGYLGDTEPDGDVDIDDLGNVLLGWPDNPLDPTQNIAWSVATYGVPWGTDIDHDNYVDTDDLGWVLWNY